MIKINNLFTKGMIVMFDFNRIINDENELSKMILEDMYPTEKFTDSSREGKAISDIKWTLKFIMEALFVENKTIIEKYLHWLKVLFTGLHIDESHVFLLFRSTKQILHDFYKEPIIDQFLSAVSLEEISDYTTLVSNNPYETEQEQYLQALLSSDRGTAQKVVYDMLENGVSISDIYLYIFQETMREVGMLWQESKIQVGREHYCTAVTQYLMSTMYAKVFSSDRKNKRLLACAVGSELHEMGIRMVADLFELNGWDTNYLGANLPTKEIIDFAKVFHPHVIALSITMPYHISVLEKTIARIREEPDLKDTKIIIGGLPFVNNPTLFQKLGADACASNAIEGIEIANKLV